MKVKRLLALAMASVLMLSSAQTNALEVYAAEIPAVEEQSVQDVMQDDADVLEQVGDPIIEDGQEDSFDDELLQSDPEDEELIQDNTETDAEEMIITSDSEEEVTFDEKVTEEDIEADETVKDEGASKLMATNGFYLDANGGIFPDSSYVKELNYIATSIGDSEYKPQKKGAVFIGWYKDSECTELVSKSDDPYNYLAYNLKETPEKGSTIYAGWGPYYTVTYVFGTEDGTDPIKNTGYYWDATNQVRVKQLEYKIPRTEGYKISDNSFPNSSKVKNEDLHYAHNYYWYEDEDRTQKVSSVKGAEPGGDITYYAGYSNNYNLVTVHINDLHAYFTQDQYDCEQQGQYDTFTFQCSNSYQSTAYLDGCIPYAVHSYALLGAAAFYYDADITQKVTTDNGYYTVTKDVDMYIWWYEHNKIITFDANGGYFYDMNNPLNQEITTKDIGHTVSESRVKISAGKVLHSDRHMRFLGWGENADDVTPKYALTASNSENNYLDISIPISEDTQYYAIWKKTFKLITFEAGEGTFDYINEYGDKEKAAKTAVMTTNSTGYAKNYPTNITPVDDSYLFEAWYEQKTNKKIANISSYHPTEDVTLVAHYVKIHNITFDSGEDGTFDYFDEDGKKQEGVKFASFRTNINRRLSRYPQNETAIDPDAFFDAWYLGDERIEDISAKEFDADADLVAKFYKIYTVKFVSDGSKGKFKYKDENGNDQEEGTEVTYNTGKGGKLSYYPENPVPVSEDLVFEGWFDTNGNKVDLNTASFIENTVLTAKFVETYSATLDVSPLTVTITKGDTAEVKAIVTPLEKENDVTWSSDKISVATVTPTGATATITAVDEGTATITATLGTLTKELTVTVTAIPDVASVEKPVASVAPGAVKKNTIVTLSTATYDADIFYTENGSDPVVSETGTYAEPTKLYKDGFNITADKTIKAIAWKEGMNPSAVETFAYTIDKVDWGELDEEAKALFKDPSEVPTGVWFIPGDSQYFEAGAVTSRVDVYTGSKITFNSEVKVYHGTSRLIENRDYTLTFANNTVAAVANIGAKAPKVTVKGKGNYSSNEVFYFTIAPANINHAVIISEKIVAAAVDSKLANVKPVVVFEGKKLTVNKDYVLEYYKGTDRISDADLKNYKVESGAEYTIKVTGKGGNFEAATMSTEVIVKPYSSKDKSIVQASKLKAVDDKNKAMSLAYTGDGANFVTLFDNTEGKTPAFFVKNGNVTLTYNKDYYIIPDLNTDHKSAGKHSFTIVGRARELTEEEIAAGEKSYYGAKTITYSITGFTMKQVKITGLLTSVEYTGKEITVADISNPEIVLTNSKTKYELKENTDYTMEMKNAGTVGKFNVVFTGINGYEGTVTKAVTVKTYNVKNDAKKKLSIEVAEGSVYTKAGARPAVTVTFDGKLLKEGSDYTLTYKNNLKVAGKDEKGAPTVTVTGKGNFTGANASKTFSIAKGDVKQIVLTSDDVNYNAKGKKGYFKVVPKLTEAGKAVTAGKNKDVDAIAKTDYVYTYAADTVLKNGTARYKDQKVEDTDEVLPGAEIKVTAKVTCQGSKTYGPADGAVIEGTYRIIETGMNIKSAKASIKKEVLNSGKLSYHDADEIIPLKSEDIDVTMKVKGQNVTLKSEDYEVVSITGNRFLGTATVTIKGKGAYGGTKSFTFKISAKKF